MAKVDVPKKKRSRVICDDSDEEEFRPALAARDGKAHTPGAIPDGFYLVGDRNNPQPAFQAAIIEAGLSIEALKVLPDIAAAVSEPLSRGGSTTIISQGGNGSGTGAARLTEDVVQVLSQLGPIMQQLSGVDLDDFLRGVAALPGAAATNLRGSVTEQLHDGDEE